MDPVNIKPILKRQTAEIKYNYKPLRSEMYNNRLTAIPSSIGELFMSDTFVELAPPVIQSSSKVIDKLLSNMDQ